MVKLDIEASPGTSSTSFLRRILGFDGLDALIAILFWKLGTFATAYVAWTLLPFNQGLYEANYRYGDRVPESFLDSLNTWDSQHYIRIAERGYEEGLLTNAFGPLFPLLIRATNVLTDNSIISGLLLANVASAAALYLLYRLVAKRWDRDTAFATLLLTMAFPTAFFLNIVYTEALFLLLIVLLFYALYERKLWLAAMAGFLLPLLRVPGLVALVPIAWFVVEPVFRRGDSRVAPTEAAWTVLGALRRREALLIVAPLAGLAVYLLYMHFELGNAFVAMDAEKQFISHRSVENLLHPDKLIGDFFRSDYSVHGYLDSAIDRIFFAVFALSLPLVYRRVDRPMFLFCAIIGLQPFLGSFMSYIRLMLVAFPLYIAYASAFTRWRPRLTYAVIYPLLLLQSVFLALQLTSSWVA